MNFLRECGIKVSIDNNFTHRFTEGEICEINMQNYTKPLDSNLSWF
jgi:hypothetical protein